MIWKKVIDKLNGTHCISIDLRGHGQSTKTDSSYDWDTFVPDIEKIAQELELTNVIGVGHSMGGHIITSVATKNPKLFKGLILCDPSIFDSNKYSKKKLTYKKKIHPVAKRKNSWASVEEMYQRLSLHPNFAQWESDVLRDYCQFGLTWSNKVGSYILSCPPQVEADMYGAYIDPKILKQIPLYRNPVRILLARERTSEDIPGNFGPSITRSDLPNLFPNSSVHQYDNLSHFLPMENTGLVASEVKNMIDIVNKV